MTEEEQPTELEAEHRRAFYAIQLKHERENLLASIPKPKRRSPEIREITKALAALHVLLQDYALREDPPAIADFTAQAFAAFAAELLVLCIPKPKPA